MTENDMEDLMGLLRETAEQVYRRCTDFRESESLNEVSSCIERLCALTHNLISLLQLPSKVCMSHNF